MRKSIIALTLLVSGATLSAEAGPAPAAPTCANWGTADSAGVIRWDTRWATVDGKEAAGALTFTMARDGELAGAWADSGAGSAVWSHRARPTGPTLRGAWGVSSTTPGGGFLLRRWATPSRGADGALYCSFDGEYTINGDHNRYKWSGWRRAN